MRKLIAVAALAASVLTACGQPTDSVPPVETVAPSSSPSTTATPAPETSPEPSAVTTTPAPRAEEPSSANATAQPATAAPPATIAPSSGVGAEITTTPAGAVPATVAVQAAAGRGEPVDCHTYRCVALTFDDGPGDQTPELLASLTSQQVPATFFMQGLYEGRNPGYVAQIAATPGMVTANHTVNHPELSHIPLAAAVWEITQNHADLLSYGATRVTWMRPPYGLVDADVAAACAQVGEAAITWNLDSIDYNDHSSASVTQRVLSQAEAGSVVLMHDIHPWSVAAVPGIIAGLKEQGFVLVNLDQLLGPARPGALYEIRDPSLIIR